MLTFAAPLVSLVLLAQAGEVKVGCVEASDRGQELRDQGRLQAAQEAFVACAASVCPEPVQLECARWLADVERRLPTLLLRVRGGDGHDLVDVRVTIDGAPLFDHLDGRLLTVDPGLRRFRFTHPSFQPVEQTFLIREGEKARPLDIVLNEPRLKAPPLHLPEASPPAAPIPWLLPPLLGIGVLGGAGFTYFGLKVRGDVDRLRATCAPDCAPEVVASAKGTQWVANISLAVGIVALGAAAWIFFDRESSEADVQGPPVDAPPPRPLVQLDTGG